MDYMTIDSVCVPIEGEKNILSVIRKAGIDLPTFCYHSELSIYGACRMCVVEDERGKIMASCSEQPRAGMVIKTNTPRLQHYRKLIIELLLSSHCRDCTTCRKNGSCTLQDLSYRVGVNAVRFLNNKEHIPMDMSSPCIVRDPNKCILCGDCVRTCDEMQGVGAIDFAYRGANMQVMPAFNKKLSETKCVGCGQCRVVCPTGAITINSNVTEVFKALADPSLRVVAQIAPAVRVAVGDKFGIPKGENSMGKLVAALRRMGFDEVYDTAVGADLTVTEESREFIDRLKNGGKFPMFTSCCPGWVKYCENFYPEFRDNLSTCRSPQGMFSAVIKEYYRDENNNKDNRKTYIVSIMPCTAKKAEILRPEHFTDGEQDTDAVLTTTEIIRMIKESGIRLESLDVEAANMPFGFASGAGVIFGVTGGVTEAVLRELLYTGEYKELSEISFTGIRGEESMKEATIHAFDKDIKIAVVHGLVNAGKLLDMIKSGEAYYDFVEVMACRRGCVLGGGQPIPAGARTRKARMEGLYKIDMASQTRCSSQNPMIQSLYDGVMKGKVHKLLHNEKV